MANEITYTAELSLKNGEFIIQDNDSGDTVTQVTANGTIVSVACTTSDTAITISGITAPRWCKIKNAGSVSVKVGPTSGGAIVPMITLEAGERAVMPLTPSVALRCQTASGTTKLLITALET